MHQRIWAHNLSGKSSLDEHGWRTNSYPIPIRVPSKCQRGQHDAVKKLKHSPQTDRQDMLQRPPVAPPTQTTESADRSAKIHVSGLQLGCKAMHRHLEVLRHLAHQTRKRCLAKKQIAVLLVLPANGSTRQHEGACGINFSLPDLPQRDGPWLEALNLWARLTPPVMGAVLRAAFAATAFLGACPPVDLLAVCLVLRPPASARCKTRALVAVGSPCHVWRLTAALPFYHRPAAVRR